MRPLRILPILCCFTLLGCEDFFDCLIAREPSIANKEFPIATVGNYYEVSLNSEIKNEPRDNDYDYFFEVSGLPEGMDYSVDYRRLYIEGTPTESGFYRVNVRLDVDGPFRNGFENEDERLCNYSTSKTYILEVE